MSGYRYASRGILWAALLAGPACLSCSSNQTGRVANEEPLPPVATSGSSAGTSAEGLAAGDRQLIELAQGDPRARLIQSEASLTIQTEHQDSLHRRLAKRAEALGGYVVEVADQRSQVRIPAAEFNTLLGELETWGKVSQRLITGADVTDAFRDLRLALDNAEARKARLLELLEATADVDEKLRIEAELERVSLEIDRLTARLAESRHGLKFATVTVETEKPDKDWKPGYVLEGLHLAWKGVRSLVLVR
jgi:hypothetical protein